MVKEDYIQVRVQLPDSYKELAVAWLSEVGYEGFDESEVGRLDAYISEAAFEPSHLESVLSQLAIPAVTWSTAQIPAQNWNSVWESAYSPVSIAPFCQVVSTFHLEQNLVDPTDCSYTIVIDPKMSFGTGHHETTRLMIQMMERIKIEGLSVLDMGCGTGVLGILAAKMGARRVKGIDIDPWSVENSTENISLNSIHGMSISQGDVSALEEQKFDLILANINMGVLKRDIPLYAQHLTPGGQLLISGFYPENEPELLSIAEEASLEKENSLIENDWMGLSLHLNTY